MEHAGIWITVFIGLFVLGSVFGLRVSPREKALGLMREQARKMNLHPRIVPVPDWLKPKIEWPYPTKMMAYYSVLIPDGRMPLMRALAVDGQLQVMQGDDKFNGITIALQGIYAIDMQSNCVGVYWDEESDLRATQLTAMKDFLLALAARYRRVDLVKLRFKRGFK